MSCKCGHAEGEHIIQNNPQCDVKGCACQWHDDGAEIDQPGADPAVNRLLKRAQAAEVEVEFILTQLRNAKRPHGTCAPRKRNACTTCLAQEELKRIERDWKGVTLHIS